MGGQTAILRGAVAPIQGPIHPHFQSSPGHRDSVCAELSLLATVTHLQTFTQNAVPHARDPLAPPTRPRCTPPTPPSTTHLPPLPLHSPPTLRPLSSRFRPGLHAHCCEPLLPTRYTVVPLYSPPGPSLGTSPRDAPVIRRLAGAPWPSCRREDPILYLVAWPAPALAVLVATRHRRGHPRFAVDVAPALVVGNACSVRQKCETQCAPPAVPESRFGTVKRSRTLPAHLHIADSGPPPLLPPLRHLYRGGADDSGAHTAFLICVRVFGDGLWVSAAKRGPLVASRLVVPLPITAAVVRSLSSILHSLARAVRSFPRYALLPHRQTNRFTDGDNYILKKNCLDAKQIPLDHMLRN